jgi:hypothetical protein
VFLFTVHFFNNHFRPDKLPPPDVVMFTGKQSLEEFCHDHPAQYQRMIDSGELEKYLVDAPSPQMHDADCLRPDPAGAGDGRVPRRVAAS